MSERQGERIREHALPSSNAALTSLVEAGG